MVALSIFTTFGSDGVIGNSSDGTIVPFCLHLCKVGIYEMIDKIHDSEIYLKNFKPYMRLTVSVSVQEFLDNKSRLDKEELAVKFFDEFEEAFKIYKEER